MMQVTDRAMDKLEEIRNANEPEPEQGISLALAENGSLGFTLAQPADGDQVMERDGKPVMIVPEPLVAPLDGVVMDFVQTPEQEGFTLDRPQ